MPGQLEYKSCLYISLEMRILLMSSSNTHTHIHLHTDINIVFENTALPLPPTYECVHVSYVCLHWTKLHLSINGPTRGPTLL